MNTDMKLQKVPVEKLKPAKYNPRKDLKPGDPAYEKIKRSMTTYGYVDPVIWNEVTGNIVGGHQRYKVLVAEGVKEIDCVVVHIENPQDEKALNIALNKAVGEWEPKALADLLSDLQLSGYDLGATGFDAAEVDDLFSKVHDKDVKDDNCDIDADELQPFVQEGDVWTLGRHRMVCGDSTLPENLALLMNGHKANLVVTDPPYNVAYESADGKRIQNDSMSDGQFYKFLLAAFRAVVPHLAEGASAYVFHADTEGLNFRRAFKEAGFHISGVCIWVKNTMVLGRSPYQWQHEPVLYGWLPNGKHKWFSDRKQTTIWKYDRPSQSKLHPTMKPLPLLAYPIKNSSAPNAIVLDTFGGSGSTLMACEQTDRIPDDTVKAEAGHMQHLAWVKRPRFIVAGGVGVGQVTFAVPVHLHVIRQQRIQAVDLRAACADDLAVAVPIEQQVCQHGFPPDERGHLQIRLVVDQAVQRVLYGLPAAFVRGFIHMEGQAGDGFGNHTHAGVNGRNLNGRAGADRLAGTAHAKVEAGRCGHGVLGLVPRPEQI